MRLQAVCLAALISHFLHLSECSHEDADDLDVSNNEALDGMLHEAGYLTPGGFRFRNRMNKRFRFVEDGRSNPHPARDVMAGLSGGIADSPFRFAKRSGGNLADRNMFRFVDYDSGFLYPEWDARSARLSGRENEAFRFVSKRSPDPAAAATAGTAASYGGFMRNLREGDGGRRYLLWRKIAGK